MSHSASTWGGEALQCRTVRPEWLDKLAPASPRACRSRRDLRRVNDWMGNAGLVIRSLERAPFAAAPKRIVELGAGDGTFLLQVARRLSVCWPNLEAVLVDKADLLASGTRDAFQSLGWSVRSVQADVFEWLNGPPGETAGVLLANLFLHHFSFEQLRLLLGQAAERTHYFVACEPERSRWALAGARLLWTIGCNDVTRHDAIVSVRAGFCGDELSGLWPAKRGWQLSEKPAGWFSHLFQACRTSGGEPWRG